MSRARPTTARYLWLLSAIFIIYGTSIPFHFVWDMDAAAAKLPRIGLSLFVSPETGRRVSIPDVVQNVLLFIPFGAFGVLAAGAARLSVVRVLLVTISGALLSASVESVQLFTSDRTSSLNDVFTNTTGTLIGAVVAVALARGASGALARMKAAGLTDAPALYPFLVALAVVVMGAWQPFDPSLDVGTTVSKLRAVAADPWQASALSDEVLEFVRYVLAAALGGIWLRQIGVRQAGVVAAVLGVAAAFALESVQIIIDSRMPGLKDALVHASGALVGAALSGIAFRTAWPWVTAIGVATAVGVAVQMLNPFIIAAEYRPVVWAPFLAYYEFTSSQTVSHVADLVLAYLPLGFALSFLARRESRLWLAAIGASLLIAAPLEYMQGWIAGRYPDVTDLGVAVLGCVIGAWAGGPGWRAFQEQLSAGPRSSTPEDAPRRTRRRHATAGGYAASYRPR